MLRSDVLFIRNGTRRAAAKIVRHHRIQRNGAVLYAAIMLVPDGRGGYLQVRDPLTMPFPKPVIGEMVAVVHPIDHPQKARIPHPWFRTLVYGGLGYVFVVIGLDILGLG